jgi:hypothetical protein
MQWCNTCVFLVTQQYLRITMETDVSTQQCKRRHYYGNGDVIYKERFGMNYTVWLRIVRGQTCLCVGAGKWQVNDVYTEVPLWTDSPTMDCPDMCLEAF